MSNFDPAKPVSWYNYLVEVTYYLDYDRPELERSAFFGTEKAAAQFVNDFDYENGDIFGWNGRISSELLNR